MLYHFKTVMDTTTNINSSRLHGRNGHSEENLLRLSTNRENEVRISNKHNYRRSVNLETSYTSQDSGYVPSQSKLLKDAGAAMSSSRHTSDSSSRYSGSSNLSNGHHCDGGMNMDRTFDRGQSDRPRDVRSRSVSDIYRKSKKRKQMRKQAILDSIMYEQQARSKSHCDVCESLDTLSTDNMLESLDSSQSSLHFMTSSVKPKSASTGDADSHLAAAAEILDNKTARHSTHFNEGNISFAAIDTRGGLETGKYKKSKKKKPWGTVGSIPCKVKQDHMSWNIETALRTRSTNNFSGKFNTN